MTATILPPRELAVIRGIAKSAAVLIALLMIERMHASRATTENELAHILQVDVRTVHKQCLYLSASGLVSGQGADRWMLTPEGRGTLFGENPLYVVRSIEESAVLLSEGVVISAQNVLLEEEEAKFAKIVHTSSSSDLSSESASRTFCATTKQILQAAAELFEADVYLHDVILDRDPEFVLGWVAKAYNDKSRLSSPTSLIYRRLMDLTELPVMYRRNPVRGLPAEFLRSIGMVSEAEKADSKVEPVRATFELGDYYPSTELPDDQVGDGFDSAGRHLQWLEVLRDDRFLTVRGVSFTGREKVVVESSVMCVSIRRRGVDEWDADALKLANEHVSPIASQIYADQCGVSTARVVFVLEEV
jgi:hypothetical protein